MMMGTMMMMLMMMIMMLLMMTLIIISCCWSSTFGHIVQPGGQLASCTAAPPVTIPPAAWIWVLQEEDRAGRRAETGRAGR